MTASENPQKPEHPSTYFVQDRQNQQELARLTVQDQLMTSSMGGAWPEQPDPGHFQQVLDVGCGSGNWAIEAARAYPETSLIGVDISERMVEYANQQAALAGVQERVKFKAMDALRMLEFSNASFDLVNIRFGVSFLRTWDWPRLLSEFRRVSRTGGVIRLTEIEVIPQNLSQSLTRIFEMLQCAFLRAGHLFENEIAGLDVHLVSLLKQHVSSDVHLKKLSFTFHAGTPQGEANRQNMEHGTRTLRPFFQKWGCLTGDYDALVEQALSDMQQPDFQATWNLATAWATVL